jgi:hypothetical protein
VHGHGVGVGSVGYIPSVNGGFTVFMNSSRVNKSTFKLCFAVDISGPPLKSCCFGYPRTYNSQPFNSCPYSQPTTTP